MLNTFSYTGAFSVAAAMGGAIEPTSIDCPARWNGPKNNLPSTIWPMGIIKFVSWMSSISSVTRFARNCSMTCRHRSAELCPHQKTHLLGNEGLYAIVGGTDPDPRAGWYADCVFQRHQLQGKEFQTGYRPILQEQPLRLPKSLHHQKIDEIKKENGAVSLGGGPVLFLNVFVNIRSGMLPGSVPRHKGRLCSRCSRSVLRRNKVPASTCFPSSSD